MKFFVAFYGSLLACTLLCAPTSARAAENGGNVLNQAANEISDAALTGKVKAILETNKVARNYKIHVSSDRGTVTLSGHVGSSSNADYVAHLVQNVRGVESVNNELVAP